MTSDGKIKALFQICDRGSVPVPIYNYRSKKDGIPKQSTLSNGTLRRDNLAEDSVIRYVVIKGRVAEVSREFQPPPIKLEDLVH
jgi:hypothetical protein